MKIGIITFHFAHNQGAVLQCYALQKAMKKLGHEPKVIDYCPEYHTVRYSAVKNPFFSAIQYYKREKSFKFFSRVYHSAGNFVKCVKSNVKQTYKSRELAFNQFINKNLNLTDKYKTIKSLRKNPPDCDAYVSGSDQLWNPELVNGSFDPAYFLDFGSDKIKKITYAVSLKETYTEKEKQNLKELCRNLDEISIREENAPAREVLDGKYTVCIDPTLLFNGEDYEEIISEKAEEVPYIFVYGFQSSEGIAEAISIISKELGIKIINGSPERVKFKNSENVMDYSPDMFLSYIKNAEFVITNSFHGTAFSIIFKKKFVTVAHTTRGKRMIELLEKIGLSERLWKGPETDWRSEIDYTEADKKRDELKEQAFDYLKKNLTQKSN